MVTFGLISGGIAAAIFVIVALVCIHEEIIETAAELGSAPPSTRRIVRLWVLFAVVWLGVSAFLGAIATGIVNLIV